MFDRPMHMYRGTTTAGIVRVEAMLNTKRGFVGGCKPETLSLGLPFVAAFPDPGARGRSFTAGLDDHENDLKMRAHAYKQGSAIYEAVGATRVIQTPPYPSIYKPGTNRMRAKARDRVVNKFGQTQDIKNLFNSDSSQFTSGAACNPTLTIVALAIHQAQTMSGMTGRKKIRGRASRRLPDGWTAFSSS